MLEDMQHVILFYFMCVHDRLHEMLWYCMLPLAKTT